MLVISIVLLALMPIIVVVLTLAGAMIWPG
jgi:hypothetical protein